ncbi:MAG: UbiH/UbiF/VisC/COQ6 family ubiquinone biosynthesis hydroxylase [Aestuariivita sp.]|nr:UbiH/UbiF/VisC/COQ6 family ubiquinone biosynthesis hydroxylase [Aestuariivita sp.]
MTKMTDILIIGSGLNGATLAIALARAGHGVTIIDQAKQHKEHITTFDGRSYALALASQRLLEAIDVWGKVANYAQPILEIKVSDGCIAEGPAPFWIHFDKDELDEGPMGYMIEDRHLRPALLKAISQENKILLINEHSVISQEISTSGVKIILDNDVEVEGRILVGSDGGESDTAKRAGITYTKWNYHQESLVCAVRHELPHNGIAHQLFLPAGPLAILPLENHRSSIVWSEDSMKAQQINAMTDEEYMAELGPRFGHFLGDIILEGKRYSYPLRLSLAQNIIDHRLALIGDAAHTIHPIAGQGLNAGLRDVGALTEVLTKAARRGEDIGSITVLKRYQQWRRFDTVTLALATDSFNRIFSNDIPIFRAVRNVGMGIVNSFPDLKRKLIREAAGLSGDLPQLLKGKQI